MASRWNAEGIRWSNATSATVQVSLYAKESQKLQTNTLLMYQAKRLYAAGTQMTGALDDELPLWFPNEPRTLASPQDRRLQRFSHEFSINCLFAVNIFS